MTPTHFSGSNRVLGPPAEHDAVRVQIAPLPVWTDGEVCVSSWRLSLRERIAALVFGRVWLWVASGKTQPPVALSAERTPFPDGKTVAPMLARLRARLLPVPWRARR